MPEVVFGHGFRHLANTGLDSTEVEAAIIADLGRRPLEAVRRREARRITVKGVEIEYRAWLDAGKITIGTYFPIER